MWQQLILQDCETSVGTPMVPRGLTSQQRSGVLSHQHVIVSTKNPNWSDPINMLLLPNMYRLPCLITMLMSLTLMGRLPACYSEKPNIIFVLADDLGWSELGCYGNSFNETPHLDQLAKDGISTHRPASTRRAQPQRGIFACLGKPLSYGSTSGQQRQ